MTTLSKEVTDLLGDPGTFKVIATSDENGNPQVVHRESITLLEDGTLAYAEPFESSFTNSNLLRGIWFNKEVSLLIHGKNGESYQIKGQPVRYVINGPLYKQFYLAEREKRDSDADLAGVWLIEPREIRNETYAARRKEEDERHPHFQHLDRIVGDKKTEELMG